MIAVNMRLSALSKSHALMIPATSPSSQCSMTGVMKAMVCVILSVE